MESGQISDLLQQLRLGDLAPQVLKLIGQGAVARDIAQLIGRTWRRAGVETRRVGGRVVYIDEASRFGAFICCLEDECRRRGQVPLSEIDARARKEDVNGLIVIHELAITEGMEVDYQRGVLVCLW